MGRSKSTHLTLLLSFCFLTSCASDSKKDLFIQEMKAAQKECPSYTRGTAHIAMECRVREQHNVFIKYYPELDFANDEWGKTVLGLSREFDDGKITYGQYKKGWDNAIVEESKNIDSFYLRRAGKPIEVDPLGPTTP